MFHDLNTPGTLSSSVPLQRLPAGYLLRLPAGLDRTCWIPGPRLEPNERVNGVKSIFSVLVDCMSTTNKYNGSQDSMHHE